MEHLNQAKTAATTNRGYRNIFMAEPMEKRQFANELISAGTNILRSTGKQTEVFTIDETNKHIVSFMYHWWNNVEHGYNRNAGIIICGKIGSGKTILMRAFLKVLSKYTGMIVFDADCKNFNRTYIELTEENGIDYFKYRPMYFDDLGREGKQVKVYGTEISPVPDVLFQRYDTGAYTFATSNYDFEYLKKDNMYGLAIADRLNSMFNVFEMTNKSRR
jgi:hypothetical protein